MLDRWMYRFRSMDCLFGAGGREPELSSHTIYFATKEQLNDALEGSFTSFYRGNSSDWATFFHSYVSFMQRELPKISSAMDAGDGEALYHAFAKRYPQDAFVGAVVKCTQEQKKHVTELHMLQFLKSIVPLVLNALYDVQASEHREQETTLQQAVDRVFYQPMFWRRYLFASDFIYAVDMDGELVPQQSFDDSLREGGMQHIHALTSVQAQAFFDVSAERDRFSIYRLPERFIRAYKEKFLEDYRIASFFGGGGAIHSQQMWGVYGDASRGACLCFDAGEKKCLSVRELDAPLPFEKVRYQEAEEYGVKGIYNLFDSDVETLATDGRSLYLRKTAEWANENEYRLLLSGRQMQEACGCLLHYDFVALKRIYIGKNATDEQIVKLREILTEVCQAQNHQVDVYRIVLAQGNACGSMHSAPEKLFTAR